MIDYSVEIKIRVRCVLPSEMCTQNLKLLNGPHCVRLSLGPGDRSLGYGMRQSNVIKEYSQYFNFDFESLIVVIEV